jgi:hypothetical protein
MGADCPVEFRLFGRWRGGQRLFELDVMAVGRVREDLTVREGSAIRRQNVYLLRGGTWLGTSSRVLRGCWSICEDVMKGEFVGEFTAEKQTSRRS